MNFKMVTKIEMGRCLFKKLTKEWKLKSNCLKRTLGNIVVNIFFDGFIRS